MERFCERFFNQKFVSAKSFYFRELETFHKNITKVFDRNVLVLATKKQLKKVFLWQLLCRKFAKPFSSKVLDKRHTEQRPQKVPHKKSVSKLRKAFCHACGKFFLGDFKIITEMFPKFKDEESSVLSHTQKHSP